MHLWAVNPGADVSLFIGNCFKLRQCHHIDGIFFSISLKLHIVCTIYKNRVENKKNITYFQSSGTCFAL